MLGDAGVKDLTCQIFEGGRHERRVNKMMALEQE